jgi:hypothetical protein
VRFIKKCCLLTLFGWQATFLLYVDIVPYFFRIFFARVDIFLQFCIQNLKTTKLLMQVILMKKIFTAVLVGLFSTGIVSVQAATETMEWNSPNGQLMVQSEVDTHGEFGLKLYRNDAQKTLLMSIPQVGVVTEGGGDWHYLSATRRPNVKVDYSMLTGKRSRCTNEATEVVYSFETKSNREARLVVRAYEDGLAFRYELDGLDADSLIRERTTYHLEEGKPRWIAKWKVDYEEFFPLTTIGTAGHWAYPSLYQPADGLFTLISEANICAHNSASSLWTTTDDGDYRVTPEPLYERVSGTWTSPWRVVIAGTLAQLVESTLVNDVSEPSVQSNTEWIQPGVVSWIYWAYNHGSKDYQIVKEYIDMGVALHLPYVLIDWEWDQMGNGGNLEDALRYAKEKGVKVLLWYNSSTEWVTDAAGPLFRLNTLEAREKEFSKLEKMGVAGVKIDFFSGDKQETMDYCRALLESAARHHLLVNFHGATLPRGWQRTYPNLMTTEGVYGAEWYAYSRDLTDHGAWHNCVLPYTRNVVGPMDYTPCTFSDAAYPHTTGKAHELALTVVYESALQHLADKPSSYLAQPREVQEFFGKLPTTWDETRFLSGYPGESIVLARRKENTWYVAGLNGKDEACVLSFSTSFVQGKVKRVTSFEEGANGEWKIGTRKLKGNISVSCPPRGGFVMVLEQK